MPMVKNIKLLVYPVKDIDKATNIFSKYLGVKPYIESPYYVGYKVGELEIGLDPNSKIGPIAYTDVENINASLKEMTDAGAGVVQDIKDVAKGLLISKVKDSSGNILGLRQQP
jgi:predicted enzyme related to lactoylglutathione lyase